MKYLYFSQKSDSESSNVGSTIVLNGVHYSLFLWKPSLWNFVPKGMSLFPYAVWWLMYYLHLFANQDYSILVIYTGKKLVHRSCVFPRYFRFPFMADVDLQIGDTWTATDHRGQGLATHAIHQIVQLCQKPGRSFWYVVEYENIPSIRVVEKGGFTKVGEGTRTRRFGLGVLGAYIIQKQF